MFEGPHIAHVAAMIGDPARANMLLALMDGRALTASELALAAGVTLPTTSGHLSKLEAAQLVAARKEGRHRYFALADSDVSDAIESLMTLGQRAGAVRVRTGPKDIQLRRARICYDHLAGEVGVALLDQLKSRKLIAGEKDLALTRSGRDYFAGRGFDSEAHATGKRLICRGCLDWSERKYHLAGLLGKFVLDDVFAHKWARRDKSRAIIFSPGGLIRFQKKYEIELLS